MRLSRRTITLAAVVALLAIPTTAFAADDAGDDQRPPATEREGVVERTFEEAQARALEIIAKQLRVLEGLANRIDNNRFITPGHAGQLRGDINQASNGLEALADKVEKAENWAELRPLLGQLDAYKVTKVIAPKTNEVIASDTGVAIAAKLGAFADRLDSVIARFEAAGFDVTEAWDMLERMRNQIAEGQALAEPVAGNVIGLKASDWPDPARALLADGKADLKAARASLREAGQTGRAIVEFLRELYGSRHDAVADVA